MSAARDKRGSQESFFDAPGQMDVALVPFGSLMFMEVE
jgi:hypothetical protein